MDVQGNSKGFYKFIKGTKMTKRNMVPLLNGTGYM